MDIKKLTREYHAAFRALYTSAFPKEERTPFFFLRRMAARGKAELLVILDAGRFAGLAVLFPIGELVLLGYLAMEEAVRSRGLGAAAVEAFRHVHPERNLLVEIERADGVDAADARARRKRFYLRNGFLETGVWIRLNGVAMELLASRLPVRYEDYARIYAEAGGKRMAKRLIRREN